MVHDWVGPCQRTWTYPFFLSLTPDVCWYVQVWASRVFAAETLQKNRSIAPRFKASAFVENMKDLLGMTSVTGLFAVLAGLSTIAVQTLELGKAA